MFDWLHSFDVWAIFRVLARARWVWYILGWVVVMSVFRFLGKLRVDQ